MSEPVLPPSSGPLFPEHYADTMLKVLGALIALATLGLLALGTWLYFNPSFY